MRSLDLYKSCDEVLAEFVLQLRRRYPRATLSAVSGPQYRKLANKIRDIMTQQGCLHLLPRYFQFVIEQSRVSDPLLILRRCARKKTIIQWKVAHARG